MATGEKTQQYDGSQKTGQATAELSTTGAAHPSAEKPASKAPLIGTLRAVPFRAAWYCIQLDRFHIDQTRAHTDTDTVTLAVKVGDTVVDQKTFRAGDVDNGDHDVGLRIGPFLVPDDSTLVTFNYAIVNVGGGPGDWVKKLEAWSVGALSKYFSFGTVWTAPFTDLIDAILHWTEHICDGVVAADEIYLTGVQLFRMTAGIGAHSETRFYQGYDSPGFGACNHDNSQYFVTWTVAGAGVVGWAGLLPQVAG